eukprot:gnl/MRDRNA2_/MRDRNA2_63972_c0_seq1.p1 gnl/MRDRNA2_/MRDRNA2_63972_c0~~gnl/MRDRNA2_/MRDRNA2_63972_c0_seq1.p1  ORF type:complete len:323 (+),score=54.81 gnl/MRDRNA2_/MRDRNA2_63972_c0_seq1:131-970(+)
MRPQHMMPNTRAPILLDCREGGLNVSGEVFHVDDDTLEALDILEGVKKGAYYKHDISVTLISEWSVSQGEMKCTAYFFPFSGRELLALERLSAYTQDHHALYQPGPLQQSILDLCERKRNPPDLLQNHSLCASTPSSMFVHCLRLLPGDDILHCLRAFVQSHGIEAASVVTCVGSTGQTALRPAGIPRAKIFNGKYEIVSMTGTISKYGHHLHMSISDADCTVFGGHMMPGCLVRTTAEIVLGIIEGVRFTRPLDKRTGYDELSIDELDGFRDKRQRLS